MVTLKKSAGLMSGSPSLWAAVSVALMAHAVSLRSQGEDATPVVTEPFAVVAIAGVDRFLEDVDALFDGVEQPSYAVFVRGFLSGLNDLRGIDRDRPAGLTAVIRSTASTAPHPVVFLPVTDVKELLKTAQLGKALRLETDETTGRYLLHTDKDEFPVSIKQGYAFINLTTGNEGQERAVIDPVPLVGELLRTRDLIVLLRRPGVPQEFFEEAVRNLQESAENEEKRQSEEAAADYEIRRKITAHAYDLAHAAVAEWQSAAAGLTFAGDPLRVKLEANIVFARDGEIARLVAGMAAPETQFAAVIERESPLTMASVLTVVPGARAVLEAFLDAARKEIEHELREADRPLQAAVTGMIQAVEKTLAAGRTDGFVQLVEADGGRFALVGAVAMRDADRVAAGVQRILPYAAESGDIQEVSMNVAAFDGVAVHRMRPARLRRQDRRLYGENAVLYVAAGKGALWVAVGGEGTLSSLQSAIQLTDAPRNRTVIARPPSRNETSDALTPAPDSNRPLLQVTLHALPWIDLAQTDRDGKSSGVITLARTAFDRPGIGQARIEIRAAGEGISLTAEFDEGYVRLLGLALLTRLHDH